MRSKLSSSLGTSFGWLAGVALTLAGSTGCIGCEVSDLECDDDGGNCRICDAYGCRPVGNDGGAGAGAQGGAGGAGLGGAGAGAQGGAGLGGAGGEQPGGAGGAGAAGGAGGAGGSAPVCDPSLGLCPCSDDGACEGELACVDGLCIDPCEFSYQCGSGKVCANGACVEGCDVESPCSPGYTCDKDICVLDPQNPECTSAADCGGAPAVCSDGLCSLGCSSSAECEDGEVCDVAAGACIDDPSPTPACSTTADCVGVQLCLADGYCHYGCTTTVECKLIDNRFVACDAGICKLAEELDPECGVGGLECPAGQDCISNECI
jgi:hypothetical protein